MCEVQAGRQGNAGKMELVRRDQLPNSQLCDTCRFMNHCAMYDDAEYGRRLRISQGADLSELAHNRRAAAAILDSFDDVEIKINPHFILSNLKNPEYTINGLLGDRKGIHGYKGIATAFKAAKEQGCKVVVIDFDMHMSGRVKSKISKIAQKLNFRYPDFLNHDIEVCYLVCNDSAIRIALSDFVVSNPKETIKKFEDQIKKIAR